MWGKISYPTLRQSFCVILCVPNPTCTSPLISIHQSPYTMKTQIHICMRMGGVKIAHLPYNHDPTKIFFMTKSNLSQYYHICIITRCIYYDFILLAYCIVTICYDLLCIVTLCYALLCLVMVCYALL